MIPSSLPSRINVKECEWNLGVCVKRLMWVANTQLPFLILHHYWIAGRSLICQKHRIVQRSSIDNREGGGIGNAHYMLYWRHGVCSSRPAHAHLILVDHKSGPKIAHYRLESRLAIVRIVYRAYKSVWSNLNDSGRSLSVFRTLCRLHTTFVGFFYASHEQLADEVDWIVLVVGNVVLMNGRRPFLTNMFSWQSVKKSNSLAICMEEKLWY